VELGYNSTRIFDTHCRHGMRSRVYASVGRLSVRLSVPAWAHSGGFCWCRFAALGRAVGRSRAARPALSMLQLRAVPRSQLMQEAGHRLVTLAVRISRVDALSTVCFPPRDIRQSITYNTYTHTSLYSAKNRENESEALAQDD